MIASFAAGFAGVLVFLFIFWKRLKEDYSSEIIFKSASSILAGVLIGWLVSLKVGPGDFFWLELAGAFCGLGFAVYTQKIRFYETLEALVISVLPWISFMFLKDSVISSSLISFAAFLAVLIFIFVFYYLDVHYKNFTWYKSGKIGFSGLTTVFLFFAIRSALALTGITMLSFLVRYEAPVSGVLSLTALGLLINLGIQKK